MRKKTDFSRIPLSFLVIFAAVTVGIILVGYLSYGRIKKDIKLEAYHNLSTVVRLKVNDIVNWRKDRTSEAEFLYYNTSYKKLLKEFLENPDDFALKKEISSWIKPIAKNHEYTEMYVADTSGTTYSLIYGTIDTLPVHDNKYFKECIRIKEIILSDLHLEKKDEISMQFFVPLLFNNDDNVWGVFVLSLDPAQVLFPLVQHRPELSRSAESFIVRRDGDYVLFLNELRYKKNRALTFRLPLSMEELPAALAVKGKEGIFEGRDYRGVQVLADLKKVPNTSWYLVSKVDLDEVYSPLKEKTFILTSFMVILILLIGSGVYVIWKNQQVKYYEQQLKAEQEKKALIEHIHYLIKYANDIIILSDEEGKIREVNEKAVLTYGYTSEEFTNLMLVEIRTPESRHIIDEQKRKVKEQNGYIFETVHIKKDGSVFPAEVSSRIINLKGTNYYESIIRDITERKLAEEKLKTMVTELNRSNKDLEQFAYVASHDLQEPIRMVHSYSQLILQRYRDRFDDKALEYFGFVIDGAKRMQQLVQGLLEYSRINKPDRTFEPVECEAVLETVRQNLKENIKETKSVIKNEKLPVIKGDKIQLVQLFQNLISNSIKFSGGNIPHVCIKAEEKDTEWLFSFSDNGIGIDPQYVERIFVIFQRLHDRQKYPGTGIGLAVCKKIVERHGGRIWVESEPGKGAVFYFTISRHIL